VRARDGLGLADGERTLEADVMDWADDIAYALHDLEDFYRADLLPLPALARKAEKVFSLLLEKQGEIAALLARRRQIEKRLGTAKLQESAGAELSHINRELRVARADLRTAYVGSGFCRLFREVKTNLWVKTWRQRRIRDVELIAAVKSTVAAFPIDHPYSGSPEDRARLRNYITTLTTRYLTKAIDDGQPVDAVTLGENGLAIQREAYVEVALLKALTRVYVHHDPVLSAQQVGQTDIIRVLFDLYCKALEAGTSDIFPRRVADEAREHARRMSLRNAMARRKSAAGAPLDERAVRFVVDTIASMTEAQAVKCHRRLCGLEFGSVDEGALQ
jgi:dGTPase